MITGVSPGSAAEAAGLKAGDIIKEVNRKNVANTTDFENGVKKSQNGNELLLLVKRREGSLYVVLRRGEPDE